MPPPETSDRTQTAVLWPAEGTDAYGRRTVGAPEEITVRWRTLRNQPADPKGSTVALDAEVVLDRAVAVGSTLWLGTLDDWYGVGSAGSDVEVHEVVRYQETPDVKGRQVRRTAGLVRYRGSPPGAA